MDKNNDLETITFQAIDWQTEENDEHVTIHIYGLTSENKSVVVKIPDFKPYIYLELDSKKKWTQGNIELVKAFLRERLGDNYPNKIKFVERKKNYYLKEAKFLWCAFSTIRSIRFLESIVKGYVNILGVGRIKLTVHEQRASPILQLMTIRKLTPSGWITAKRTTKAALLEEFSDQFSSCDIEMLSSYSDINIAKTAGGVTKPKVLCYDLECISGDASGNTFPNPSKITDQVICISATVGYTHLPENTWRTYCLVNEDGGRACPAEIGDGSEVRHFGSEKELLLGWRDFVNEIDPDVITGYNTLSFDDNYLSERANLLLCWSKFSQMGRLLGVKNKLEERRWASSAYGDQCFKYMSIPGRLHIDMFPVISKDYTNLQSYTLNSVSEEFLGDHKVDLPAKEMIQIWHRGETEDIRKIVEYCNKDTILPLRLMKKMNTWLGVTEMSNVMMINVFDLITRGQQIRVFSQVYSMAMDLGVVCTDKWTDYKPTEEEKIFEGATVQNPQVGFWELVATWDFMSLYPSTIIAYNLCFSTFVPSHENPPKEDYHDLIWESHSGCEHDKSVRKTKPTKIICNKCHYRFYKAEIKKGIIPMLLVHWLEARANTKKELKTLTAKIESGSIPTEELENVKLMAVVLDKRQNGYKVAANSVPGNTPIPCLINGVFEYRTIEELSMGIKWRSDDNGNQIIQDPSNILVWSDQGWTKINYIIRHRTKKLIRVLTHTGCVDCTEEHSLLRDTGEAVKPTELTIGDNLLHKDIPTPDDTPNKPEYLVLTDDIITKHDLNSADEELAFARGFFYAEGTCGNYNPNASIKSSWCIYNTDRPLLEKVAEYLNRHENDNVNFVVKDYGEYFNNRPGGSSGYYHVYYLQARGSVKKLVDKYRSLFYDQRKTKRIPQYIFSQTYKVRLAFILGYYSGDGARHLKKGVVILNRGQIGSAGLCYLMKSLGYLVSVSYDRKDCKIDHFRLQCCTYFRNKSTTAIKLIEDAPTPPPIKDTMQPIIRNDNYIEKMDDGTYLYKNIRIFCERLPRQKLLDSLDDALTKIHIRGNIIEYHTSNKKVVYKCFTCGKTGSAELRDIRHEKPFRSFSVCTCPIEDRWGDINHDNVLEDQVEYIYDIETETHHFAAGVGSMIVHNSAYGGFGSDYSYLPFYPAAASTTAMGRRSIQQAIDFAKNYRPDTVLVYGDTDSCMIHFSTIRDLKECFRVCEEMTKEINKIFPKPMYLELEKIYGKYFLLSKKRYIGHIVNEENKLIKIDKKGVVSKRRDNCAYLRNTFNKLIDLVMEKAPKWKIYEYISQRVDDLLTGNVNLEELVITKSIKDNYKAQNLPHVAVSKKMIERGKYVTSGTRIRYIFIETDNQKDPQYKKAEDPDYYLENVGVVHIDHLYYFEKQLINAIDEVLTVKFGKEDILKNLLKLIKKGKVQTAKEYFSPKFAVK